MVDTQNGKLITKNGRIGQLQLDVQNLQSELNRYKDKENLQNQKRKTISQKEIPKPNDKLENYYPDEKKPRSRMAGEQFSSGKLYTGSKTAL